MTSKHVGAGRHRELGGQVQWLEYASSYIVCFVCTLSLHPGVIFGITRRGKVSEKVRTGFMVALTGLVWTGLRRNKPTTGKMGPGVCFRLWLLASCFVCSTH